MSKHALASPTVSPTKKKGKSTGNQYSLDRFFGGPSNSSPGPSPTPPDRSSKGKVKLTAQTSQQGPLSNADEGRHYPPGARGTSSIVQDSDATLAWSLAAEDGLDLDKLRELEAAAKHNLTRQSPPEPQVEIIIIDVDNLSGQESSAGPSRFAARPSQKPGSNPQTPHEQPATSSSVRETSTQAPVLGGSHRASSADTVYARLDVDPASYVVLDNMDAWSVNPVLFPGSHPSYSIRDPLPDRNSKYPDQLSTNHHGTAPSIPAPRALPPL